MNESLNQELLSLLDIKIISELFKNSRVYYSGSIRGIVADPFIGRKLVDYMLENSAMVLSAHVAAKDEEEMKQIFSLMSQRELDENNVDSKEAEMVYEIDMGWVDNATHIVAIVDGPSHGVGMEIMRALWKPVRGLNHTPVLCLVNEENLGKVSSMIRGASFEFGDAIKVVTYKDSEDAKEIVRKFLLENSIEG